VVSRLVHRVDAEEHCAVTLGGRIGLQGFGTKPGGCKSGLGWEVGCQNSNVLTTGRTAS
jgi:hypothetical protein